MIIHMLQLSTRTLNRKAWRAYYRQTRINNRESMKAFADTMLYGSGFTRVTESGIEHIPFRDAIILDDMVDTPMSDDQREKLMKWFDESFIRETYVKSTPMHCDSLLEKLLGK